MKSTWLILILYLFFTNLAIGQQNALNKDTSRFKNNPLFIYTINNQLQQASNMVDIDPNYIDRIDVNRSHELIDKYGPRAKNGVVSLVIKPGVDVDLINTDQLFDQFKVKKRDRKLPVFLDSAITFEPYRMLFEARKVKTITVNKEDVTGVKYISITTTKPKPVRSLNAEPITIRN